MKDSKLEKVYNNILFNLDTIRIEQTSFEDHNKSTVILHLLKEVSDIVKERIYE